jgi:hypothetical protein
MLSGAFTQKFQHSLKVCHNRRIEQHKTFAEEAQRGKTSVGWFFGFKLHLIFNDEGDIVWLYCSAGNKDDRAGLRMMLENPLKKLFGKLIGDRGCVRRMGYLVELGMTTFKNKVIALAELLEQQGKKAKSFAEVEQLILKATQEFGYLAASDLTIDEAFSPSSPEMPAMPKSNAKTPNKKRKAQNAVG